MMPFVRGAGKARPMGAGLRDSMYQMAGNFGSGKNLTGHAQRRVGRRNLGVAGGIGAGAFVVNSARRSSARDGIQPHSMGGTTL